jgi:hypothetical protein
MLYITSHHITLHYITSHHITLHYITLHHITSHHITSHHITIVKVPNLLTLRNNNFTGGSNKRGREVAQIGSRPVLPLEINQVQFFESCALL